jgi:hypothetical protein
LGGVYKKKTKKEKKRMQEKTTLAVFAVGLTTLVTLVIIAFIVPQRTSSVVALTSGDRVPLTPITTIRNSSYVCTMYLSPYSEFGRGDCIRRFEAWHAKNPSANASQIADYLQKALPYGNPENQGNGMDCIIPYIFLVEPEYVNLMIEKFYMLSFTNYTTMFRFLNVVARSPKPARPIRNITEIMGDYNLTDPATMFPGAEFLAEFLTYDLNLIAYEIFYHGRPLPNPLFQPLQDQDMHPYCLEWYANTYRDQDDIGMDAYFNKLNSYLDQEIIDNYERFLWTLRSVNTAAPYCLSPKNPATPLVTECSVFPRPHPVQEDDYD